MAAKNRVNVGEWAVEAEAAVVQRAMINRSVTDDGIPAEAENPSEAYRVNGTAVANRSFSRPDCWVRVHLAGPGLTPAP